MNDEKNLGLDDKSQNQKFLETSIKSLFLKRGIILLILVILLFFLSKKDLDNMLIFIAAIFYYLVIMFLYNKTRLIFYLSLFYLPLFFSLIIYFIEKPSSNDGAVIYFPAWAFSLIVFIFVDLLALIDYEIRRKKIKGNNQLGIYSGVSFSKIQKIFAKFNLLVLGILFLFSLGNVIFTLYMQKYITVLGSFSMITFTTGEAMIYLAVILVFYVLTYLVYRSIREYDSSKKITKVFNFIIFNFVLLVFMMLPGQFDGDIKYDYITYKMSQAVASSDLKTCEDYYYKTHQKSDKFGTQCQEMILKYRSSLNK